MDNISEKPRMRSQKKQLRVTFNDGTVYCYKNATVTFIESLRKIGIDKLKDINLEIGHLPLISQECHERYKEYMKPLDNGWYVNTQSDTSQKYIQLTSIKNSLGLDYTVEIGSDFETSSVKGFAKSRKKTDCLLVQFPDGNYIGGKSPKDTYLQAIQQIGPELIFHKELMILGKEIVTRYKKYPNQVEAGNGIWVTIPSQTKDKIKVLEGVSSKLKIPLKISII
ncbi:hypothetical protein [Bacteroides acidifaciens]|uniref:hypothetical protein n=1 Tax=Bacteroides acidifaciens TaxID=85831 RepID=UPI002606378D|nr:hypothetical protein [Bacteroides acidifaciens]